MSKPSGDKRKNKPAGNKYLDAQDAFNRRHRKDLKLCGEVAKLLDLFQIWQMTVFINIMREYWKQETGGAGDKRGGE